MLVCSTKPCVKRTYCRASTGATEAAVTTKNPVARANNNNKSTLTTLTNTRFDTNARGKQPETDQHPQWVFHQRKENSTILHPADTQGRKGKKRKMNEKNNNNNKKREHDDGAKHSKTYRARCAFSYVSVPDCTGRYSEYQVPCRSRGLNKKFKQVCNKTEQPALLLHSSPHLGEYCRRRWSSLCGIRCRRSPCCVRCRSSRWCIR